MEYYISKDKSVVKYVHDDGSETAIKTQSGCTEFKNHLTGKIEKLNDRNKYVVFISSSVGCPIGCRFCYLTLKKYPHHRLSNDEIYSNVTEAIKHYTEQVDKSAKNKCIKLSFMGMGDLSINPNVLEIVPRLINYACFNNNHAIGIDGIDIGTVLHHSFYENEDFYRYLTYFDFGQFILKRKYNTNPLNSNRSLFRIFYSLHTFDNNLRKELIPISVDVKKAIEILKTLKYFPKIDVIFHTALMSGINDSYEDVYEFIDRIKEYELEDYEFRFLKLNECKYSKIRPSKEEHLKEVYKILNENIKRIKVQYSSGSEIQAACGQFIMKGNNEI